MLKLFEMGCTTTLADQSTADEGPVVLINTFVIPAEDADRFLSLWGTDAVILKAQAGFISTQFYRSPAGSGTCPNYAVWHSVAHFCGTFANPEFRERLADCPESPTISTHLFRKVGVTSICDPRATTAFRSLRTSRWARRRKF